MNRVVSTDAARPVMVVAGQNTVRGLVVVQRQSQLLEIVLALAAASGLAGGLHGRQKQRHQNGDDGNHDQQLDQRESAS